MIEDLAKICVEAEKTVAVSRAYSTLYAGLRRNHPHRASAVDPLLYVTRRVHYSLMIVFMVGDTKSFFGCLMLSLSSLAMLIFVAIEAHWESPFFNRWAFLNEAVFYTLCVSLVCFSGVLTDAKQSMISGWLLIGLVVMLVIYDSAIVLLDALVFVRLLILRHRKKFPAKLINMLLRLDELARRKHAGKHRFGDDHSDLERNTTGARNQHLKRKSRSATKLLSGDRRQRMGRRQKRKNKVQPFDTESLHASVGKFDGMEHVGMSEDPKRVSTAVVTNKDQKFNAIEDYLAMEEKKHGITSV